MVFSDIVNDYNKLIKQMEDYDNSNSLIHIGLNLINDYHTKINSSINTYLKSNKSSNDLSLFVNSLHPILKSYGQHIGLMNGDIRNISKLIKSLEETKFISDDILKISNSLIRVLDKLMDIISTYVSINLTGGSNETNFFNLINSLEDFSILYNNITSNYELLVNIEMQLYEPLPSNILDEDELSQIEFRSSKTSYDIADFAKDLSLLSEFFNQAERILAPKDSHTIFLRKIESGSLKAILGSKQIDLSLFPDFITSIVNAIKTFKMLPYEKEKEKANTRLINAEAEEKEFNTTKNKIMLVNSQIEFLCGIFNLDSKNPDDAEKIQQLCVPLIKYLERNPIGEINGIQYNISERIELIEDKSDYN